MKIRFNAFIDIPKWLSLFLIIYFVVYRIIVPIYTLILNPDQDGLFLLTLLNIIYSTLIFLPILVPFRNIGIIHPLIFTLLLGIIKGIVSSSGTNFITPFFQTDFSFGSSSAFRANEPYTYDLVSLNLLSRLYDIIALSLFYLGFISFGNKAFHFTIPRFPMPPLFSSLKTVIPIISIFGVALLILFFNSQGGITTYISSWGTSRKEALMDLGVYLSFLKRLYIFPLIWFIFNGAKLKSNPILIFVIIITIISGFFLVGSRSGIITATMPFFIVWIIRNKKIPIVQPLLVGILFLGVFGVLGQFRASTFDNEVNWDVFSTFDFTESLEKSEEELDLWQGLNADIAIYAKVPEQTDYLYGKSYLGALLFFIPRTIWNAKPRGTGYYVGQNIFGLSQAGVPPNETAEAYYNFGILGILIVFFLKGRLYRIVVNRVLRYGLTDDIFFFMAYIVFIMSFSFSVLALVSFLQLLGFLFLLKTIFGSYNVTRIIYPPKSINTSV